MKIQHILIAFYFFFICITCIAYVQTQKEVDADNTQISYQQLGTRTDDKLIIERDIDLQGGICELPHGCTMVFKRGFVKNGTLIGKDTKIVGKGVFFDHVNIKGSWIVPKISTAMFANLTYENALRDVMALTSPKIKNHVEIGQGEYTVKAEKDAGSCISVNSNTELTIRGSIRLISNDFKRYNIIHVKGTNISIKGGGCIIGDKHTHKGKQGEWGMGIYVMKSENVKISGLTIKDCWGDCIYVGGNSRNVGIENCLLDHGRRQGISITSANNVHIKKCSITNVGGTAPEYAIDVEPNKGDVVDNIIIEKVSAKDCIGGFLVYGRAEKSKVGLVTIRNCVIDNNKKGAVNVIKCGMAVIENCQISQQTVQTVIKCEDDSCVVIKNNLYDYKAELWTKARITTKNLVGKEPAQPIIVSRCGITVLKNNVESKCF